MPEWFLSKFKGDKVLWALIIIFTLFSFLAVYSTSTNLVYVVGKGTPLGYLIKHLLLVVSGYAILYGVHRVPYRFFGLAAKLLLPVAMALLLFVNLKGSTIEGANASRWLSIFGFSFQPSAFALVILMAYVASYLAKNYGKKLTFKETITPLWLPVGIVTGLVVLSNLSTALLTWGVSL